MKKPNSNKEFLLNTFTALTRSDNLPTFVVAFLVFAFIYSFFYGVFTLPILEIGFYKMEPLRSFDVFYIIAASLLSASIITLLRYSWKRKGYTNKGTSFGGMFAGTFGAICPACLGINFIIFGNVASASLVFLVPFLFWIQLAGLSLLTIGLLLTVRSSYEDICLICSTNVKKTESRKESVFEDLTELLHKNILLAFTILVVFALGYQILPLITPSSETVSKSDKGKINLDQITSQVLPEQGFTIDAKWGDSISKMVKAGVLDAEKLDNILSKRYGQPLTEEQRRLLTSDYSNEKLTINAQNAVFMMYVLWALAKHNDNPILHDSPFAQYFQNYDIGVGKTGYGDIKLIELTPEQQEIATYVSMNSYRPCCNNPTGRPDCSHGFSALGLIELMASQGYSKAEMFDAFVKFNSFWFPSTYIQDAIYFQVKESKSWDQVDKETVAGKDFSSLSGSYAVTNYLKSLGM